WDDAYQGVQSLFKELADSSDTPARFSADILARLTKLLRTLAAEFDTSEDLCEQAQFVLEKGKLWYPNDLRLRMEEAWFNYNMGRFDLALGIFCQLIDQQDPVPTNVEKVEALRGASASARERHDYLAAGKYLIQAAP